MKRPIAIWACLVVSVLLALFAALGLLRDLMQLARWLQAGGVVQAAIIITIQAAQTVFLGAVSHAAIVRPRWGRALCGLFSVMLAVALAYGALHPDPRPLFPIEPGAEQAGALIGRWGLVALGLLFAYRMVFDAKVRGYFSQRTA